MAFEPLGEFHPKDLKRPLNEVDIGFAENSEKGVELMRIRRVETAAFRYTVIFLTSYFVVFLFSQVILKISMYNWSMLFYWLKTEIIEEEDPIERERFIAISKELTWAVVGLLNIFSIYITILLIKMNTKVFSVVFCTLWATFTLWSILFYFRGVAALIGIGGFILSVSLLFAYKNERVLKKQDGYPYFRDIGTSYLSREALVAELREKQAKKSEPAPEDVFR